MRKLLLGSVLVQLICLAAYLRFHHSKPPIEKAYAANRQVTLWSTTAQVREPIATINYGERLDVLDRFDTQVKVRTTAGVVGWANEGDLLSGELWDQAQALNTRANTLPIEARGHTGAISNLHIAPGREMPRIRQIGSETAVDLYERRVVDAENSRTATSSAPGNAPDNSGNASGNASRNASGNGSGAASGSAPGAASGASSSTGAAGAVPGRVERNEDWWLVRAHLRDDSTVSGWLLGRFVSLDAPQPLPDYSSSAGMRIVAWFELNHVMDQDGTAKPQYLVTGARGGEGQPCDFTTMRVYTWAVKRARYETAFVANDVCGKLPVAVSDAKKPGGNVTFAFEDWSAGTSGKRTYRMVDTIVREVRAPGTEPKKRKKPMGPKAPKVQRHAYG
jgi:hypothetical protein